MKIEIEQLKTLVENGDKAALESYILKGLEKGDMPSVLSANADVKSFFDSEKDKHHNTALETWKSNHLDSLVDAKVKELNPELTEEQKRIAALEKALEDQKSEAQREKLTNFAMKQAAEKGLPTDLINFFLATDEESTAANLTKFGEVLTGAVQDGVDAKFKEAGRDINRSTEGEGGDFGAKLAKNSSENVAGAEKAQENYFG